jgi:hypothetical protein
VQHRANWFCACGLSIGVERGFITRDDAIKRTLTTLRFFWNSPQGPEPDATGYKGFYYGEYIWGLTGSDGPGPASKKIGGKLLRFYDYEARGVPNGPDDGTLAPWAVIASLPFAPEIVLPSLQYFDETFPEMTSKYGFKCSFNPTFSTASSKEWISKGYYGLDQGPIVLMIENYHSGFLWRLMRGSPYIVSGLRRAGFSGGWLQERE